MRKLFTPQLNVSQESIAFQSTAFLKELTLHIDELKKLPANKLVDSDEIAALSAVINHHTNLNVSVHIGKNQPQVNIPMVNKNNILVNSFIRDYINSSDGLKLIQSAKNSVKGSVDLNSGKVHGVFTEVKSIVELPIEMFTSTKFDSEEIAAIILHEVGHLFVYYEFMTRSVTTNQMLAGVAKALDKSDSVQERESILLNAKKEMNLTELDVEALTKSNNNKVIEVVLITNISKQTTSELGSNIYDFSTWEYLADQYATRQGAGRQLVTGLAKIYKGGWNISFRSTPTYLAFEALKLITVAIGISGQLSAGNVVGVMATFVLLLGIDADNVTYDRPGERFKRIRDQIVQNLKDKDLSKESIEDLNTDLTLIDKLLDNVNDRRQWLGAVWDIVSPSARRGRSQEMLQKELEDLAVNELFVKAASLKQLA